MLDNLTSTVPKLLAFEPSLAVDCNDITRCRTLEDIVWSCLSVVVICTWTAVHPNVPVVPQALHWMLVTWDKFKIFVVALIAPELIVLWAMRQWVAARNVLKKYRKYGWTKAHAYLALMGGYALYDEDEFVCHLWDPETVEEEPQREVRDREVIDLTALDSYSCLLEFFVAQGFISIKEEDIWDSLSGSDTLAKVMTIIQISWFILQCFGRAVERLAITELEILTLAFATLNFATYVLWWNKPLRVRRPVRVQWR
ncbi:hypothetical protein L218DRAFT_932341, partial [Marasmius fiardii PR-910]